MKRLIRCSSIVVLVLLLASCGKTPTAPTPVAPAAPTRIVNVTGNLAFGEVAVGASREMTMTIANSGNAVLTVTSLSISGGLAAHTTASWVSGTIPPSGSQSVLIRFAPTTEGTFSGSLQVNGDQTSGTNSVAISGTSVSLLSGTWTGTHTITACDGTGSVQDLICSAARGSNKVGSSLSFSVTLSQSGSSVTGTANCGGVVGPVTGTLSAGGTLTLAGTLTGTGTSTGFTSVITSWATTTSGSSMNGTVSYDLTFRGVPGVAGISARLTGVTKR